MDVAAALQAASVWLVGAGPHAKEYGKVLRGQAVPFIVIGRGEESARKLEIELGVPVIRGGLDGFLATKPTLNPKTVAIVSVNIPLLGHCTKQLIKFGVDRILVEKPGAASEDELQEICQMVDEAQALGRNTRVLIAYNRHFYASTRRAQELIEADGGVTSFVFEFTEWSHIIGKLPHPIDVKLNWFLGNNHCSDLAFYLGGLPTSLKCDYGGVGEVDWHPQASKWVGCGTTDTGAVFSYHANWAAPGRWWLEVCTRKNRYIFRPMERLHVTPLGTVKVTEVEIDNQIDLDYKPGLYLQTETFLADPHSPKFYTVHEQLSHMANIFTPMRCVAPKIPPRIIIIGAGNIGCRHLQSLVNIDDCQITVVDPAQACLDRAMSIFNNDQRKKGTNKSIVFAVSSLDHICDRKDYDVAIIATTSGVRRVVMDAFLTRFHTRYMILEKVLFQTEEDHYYIQRKLNEHGIKAWAHVPTRTYPFMKDLKEKLAPPVNMTVQGRGWGLCCNSVHALGLATYFNNSFDVKFNPGLLHDSFIDSKRQGYVEINGTLGATVKPPGCEEEAQILLTCVPSEKIEEYIWMFSSRTGSIYWDKLKNNIMVRYADNNWECEVSKFQEPFASQWSALLVKQLLDTGSCDLPAFDDIIELSVSTNRVFTEHLKKLGNADALQGKCPIT